MEGGDVYDEQKRGDGGPLRDSDCNNPTQMRLFMQQVTNYLRA